MKIVNKRKFEIEIQGVRGIGRKSNKKKINNFQTHFQQIMMPFKCAGKYIFQDGEGVKRKKEKKGGKEDNLIIHFPSLHSNSLRIKNGQEFLDTR